LEETGLDSVAKKHSGGRVSDHEVLYIADFGQPFKVRLGISREHIYKDIKGGLALELTGMAQRQNSLLSLPGTLTSSPPQNSRANGSFSFAPG